jgi:hypothetical protein
VPVTDTRLDTAVKLTRIAVNVSVILGIVFALSLARDWMASHDQQLRTNRIVQARHVADFALSHLRQANKIAVFVETLPPNCTKTCLPAPAVLYDNYGKTGEKMYNAPELAEFREIGDSFEILGTLVRKGYLDFDFVYTVIFFPDDFWNKSKPYRDQIQQNWNGLAARG